MVKLIAATVVLTFALTASASRAGAQESTSTRRPTPTSTPTRTQTTLASPSVTPTAPMADEDVFLCSAGTRDGSICTLDSECPAGACVLPQGVCSGGSRDSEYCEATSECADGGSCLLSQRVCLAGPAKGVSCLRDDQCTESQCVSTGLFCDGGDFDLFSCVDDGGCLGTLENGSCRSPDVFLCSAGPNDSLECRSDLDCPSGVCVIAQKICNGGEANGVDCEGDVQCPDGACLATAMICSAGDNKSFGCLSGANCPGGACVSTGKVCSGGAFDSIACVDNTSCTPPDEEGGECIVAGPDFYCSGGTADAQRCSSDDECPQGACVFSQGVCSGGPDDGDFCETSADCGNAVPCLQTQNVCLAGDFAGFSCLNNGQCGSGIVCGPSGLFCEGGDFDRFSCVVDDNCCDDDGCDGDDADGFCSSPDVFLCSAGQNDNLVCTSHFDCPGGACVVAQKVCDGGPDDGFGCAGDVNCSGGARCLATARICSGGEDDSFGCARNDNCRGGGTCVASGQVCDGGDTAADDYDPFALFFSCTNDQSCADATLSCRAPTAVGLACSAGGRDGQPCTSNGECPDGVCVLQDALCEGGARDEELCDTGADCPSAGCRATHRVCETSGLSCVNDDHCDEAGGAERCVSTGRVCSGSAFGAFSCADDGNCFDSSDPDGEQGACVGLTPRPCSLEAPCALQTRAAGEVFGLSVNPESSPATFDFFLAPIAGNAAGAVIVLRPNGSDADVYVGRAVSSQIFSATDYPFASNNSFDTTDFVRLSPQSTPPWAEFRDGIDEFAVAVAGVGGETPYEVQVLFLGASAAGDANCDGAVDAGDASGLVDVLFDPAARLTPDGSAFGRCLGADGNTDGAETVADIIAAVRARTTP